MRSPGSLWSWATGGVPRSAQVLQAQQGRPCGATGWQELPLLSQLEALHATAPEPQQHLPAATGPALPAFAAQVSDPLPRTMAPPPWPIQPTPALAASLAVSAEPPPPVEPPPPAINQLEGFSLSSMSKSSSDSDSDEEATGDPRGSQDQERLGKRKRGGSGGSGTKKMMAFFERLMRQIMEQQEAMQRSFLETMEKREAERTARGEAWRRQEVARLNREHEQLAQERAAAASRDAAVISFLQHMGGLTVQVPPSGAIRMPTSMPPRRQPLPLPPPPLWPQPILAASLQQQPPAQTQQKEMPHSAPPSESTLLELKPVAEQHLETGYGRKGESAGLTSSRWPKAEVDALIQLRTELEARYENAGPKDPLWEDISAGMRQMGYSRSAKRCKEKWENINNYFKKVKESNKKRPEDSKTCPYFHQLDEIYRRQLFRSSGGAISSAANAAATVTEQQQNPSQPEIETKNSDNNDKRHDGGVGKEKGNLQVPTSDSERAATASALDDGATNMPRRQRPGDKRAAAAGVHNGGG